ncbi:MAG TPA: xanthine dehydrogenase accessory protein XdhC [Bdellovibrionota bacterium]|nr:xanthine dehydrogenase accessory protein XdhC [Bdellovibrionota bacterium]
MELLDTIARLRDEGETFVVATVVSVVGSTPRKPGSRMIVHRNGRTEGTIGGGALEKSAIEDARTLFGEGETFLKKYDLTHEIGMCCGGIVELFFEKIAPTERLYIFGAGHVGKPLAAIAKLARFHVTVIDDRSEHLNETHFPAADERRVAPLEDVISDLAFDNYVSVVVCTHDHQLDQRIVEACLAKPFRYLGLIGSFVKATKTRARLKAAGFDEDAIHRVHSPTGLNIGSQSPGEIAVAIVAELIAQRYGAKSPYSWKPEVPLR